MAKWQSVNDPELRGKYNCRHVRVLLNNKREWYGWCGGSGDWRLFDCDADIEDIKKYPTNDKNKTHIVRDGAIIGWLPIDDELAPAIPAGWTPADEPPDGIRDVLVMLKGGEKRLGWYSESAIISGGNWYLYPEGTTPKSIDDDDTSFDDTPAAPGEVLAWCEIEPKRDPRVRYVVVAIPTLYDTLEEAELHAQRAVENSRVNVVIARVVEEVKPGKPEIIRMEE